MAHPRVASRQAPDLVWGSPSYGLSLSVRPSSTTGALGHLPTIELRLKNIGATPVQTEWTDGYSECRMALFDADGRPAAVSGDVRKEEARVAEWFRADLHAFKWRASSDSGIVLAPGEVDLRVVDLTKWFDVKVPGEYSLVVGRYLHFAYSGDPRVVMSNLAKITIAR